MFLLLPKQNSMLLSQRSQFFMNGFFVPYRLDRDRNTGGIMICISDNILSRLLAKHIFPVDIKGLLIEHIS